MKDTPYFGYFNAWLYSHAYALRTALKYLTFYCTQYVAVSTTCNSRFHAATLLLVEMRAALLVL